MVYDESFVAGQIASAAAQQAWDCFLASLTPGTYTQVTISGSLDSTGVTCCDSTAVNALANALSTNTAVSVECNCRTWNTGSTAGSLEFNSSPLGVGGVDSCPNPGYVVRPKNSSSNWGGAGTGTCFGQNPSQSLRVEFS